MTYESELAKQVSYKFECKKDSFSQLQSGVTKVSITMQPDDMPIELLTDKMGQRYICVLVPIGDDEAPIQKPKSYAQQAKMLAKDVLFDRYLKETHLTNLEVEKREDWIRNLCGVDSCSKITEGTTAGRDFKDLQSKVGKFKAEQERYNIR